MQTSNLGTARRSRRSRKAPEHFASQQAGLKEPDIESIERMFKMQEDARKNGKEANICICGIKLPRVARVCKFCGWELSTKGEETVSLTPSTPLPKKRKRQLPQGKGQPSKKMKPMLSGFVGIKNDSSQNNPLKVDAANPPLLTHPSIKIPSKPLNRRVQAWRASQCRIKWHRKHSQLTIMEPTIPCEAPWCRRWFFRDSDMLMHKFIKHIKPPFGYADQNTRNHIEIDDVSDSSASPGYLAQSPLNLVCSWSGCGKKFQTAEACGNHVALMHKKRGRKPKTGEQGSTNGKRVNAKKKHIPTKTLCAVCSKPGGYTQGIRLQMCSLCQNPCHMNCAITETSSVQPARKIYTCRFCHDRISRESMREIEAKIPIWNIYSTEEKFNPKNAEIDYIDGFCIKSYCCS